MVTCLLIDLNAPVNLPPGEKGRIEHEKMIDKVMEWLETNVLGACAKVDIEECIETFDEI